MGEIMTDYNAAELRELLAAKNVDLSNNEQAASAFETTWAASDAGSAAMWWTDWATMRDAYNRAQDDANSYLSYVTNDESLAFGTTKDTDYDATASYSEVLTALNSSWQENTPAPGSFDDLVARLDAAMASLNYVSPVKPQPIPQPNPANDSGVNPTSWEGYLTGALAKLGIVHNPPAGTPGTQGAPPLIPTLLKVGAVAGAGLWAWDKFAEIRRLT